MRQQRMKMDWLAYVTEMTELGIRNNTHTGS